MTLYGFSQKTAIFAKTFWRMRVLIINTSERIGGRSCQPSDGSTEKQWNQSQNAGT